MRRHLVLVIAIGSLRWAAAGAGVLAVVIHDLVHHPAPHDHHEALLTAVHGHAHEGTPVHDHVVSAPLGPSRAADAGPSANLAADVATPFDDPRRDAMATPCTARPELGRARAEHAALVDILRGAGCEVLSYRGEELSLKAEGAPICLGQMAWDGAGEVCDRRKRGHVSTAYG